MNLTTAELEARLDHLRDSPADVGTLELVVRRPGVREREELEEGHLDVAIGLIGDTWSTRPSKRTPDGSPHPDMQITVMNVRAALLVAGDPARRALAGDQLYVDLDLSPANVPPGSLLSIGTAVLEVTDQPHTGCAKFLESFGRDALAFVNGRAGRALRLRGLNAKVVTAGTVRPGDPCLLSRPQPTVEPPLRHRTAVS